MRSFKALMVMMLAQIRRERLLLPLPFALAELQGAVLQVLPVPPLTRDQVRLLRHDNVVADDALTLGDLGVTPTALEAVIPTYLDRHRPRGRSAGKAAG